MKFVKRYLNRFSFKSILDVGGGNGEVVEVFRRLGFERAVNLDKDKEVIEDGKRRYPLVEHILADFMDYSFREKFSCVVSTNVFHHFVDWTGAVKKVYEILESGGGFFLHQHCKGSFCSLTDLAKEILIRDYGIVIPYQKSFLTFKEILNNLENLGFEVISVERLHEIQGEHSLGESYKSWLVGAGRDFMEKSPDPEEFFEKFLNIALKKELPIESVRIMVAAIKK